MKSKRVFWGLIFVFLLYNIISTDSNVEKQHELFYMLSPLIIIFSTLIIGVTVKKISKYFLIGLILSILLTHVILNFNYASSIKLTAPKASFYLFVILIFILQY